MVAVIGRAFYRELGIGRATSIGSVILQGAPSATILGRSDDYCHMKFPAIREETLAGNDPILKDAGSGDIVDFYGPCDRDPMGKDEVHTQLIQIHHGKGVYLGE